MAQKIQKNFNISKLETKKSRHTKLIKRREATKTFSILKTARKSQDSQPIFSQEAGLRAKSQKKLVTKVSLI